MSRRAAVTRANRRRQWAKERVMFQTNGHGLPKFANPIVAEVTLEVRSLEHTYLARYGKTRLGKWKLLRCDPEVEFLRYCGRQDARVALQKRGLAFKWL